MMILIFEKSAHAFPDKRVHPSLGAFSIQLFPTIALGQTLTKLELFQFGLKNRTVGP